jgi:hypothetical protein
LAISFCSKTKKSSTFSTFASAMMVQKGSPAMSVSSLEHLARLSRFAVHHFADQKHDVLLMRWWLL